MYPDYALMDQFLVAAVQYSMGMDDNIDVRAMTSTVNTLDHLNIIYDFIAYKKAGSVIRMIHHIVSPQVFQASLQHYIASNSLTPVGPIDLYTSFHELGSSTEPQIHQIFASWADNPGYPVLFVVRNYISNEITINQQRFLISGPSDENESNFIVPINYATFEDQSFNDTSPLTYIYPENESVKLELNYSTNWIIVNKQQTGYYRVTYDEQNWRALIQQLESDPNQIHELNRAQLIDDSYNLAKYGYLSFDLTYNLLQYLKNEQNLIPWMSAVQAFDNLRSLLMNEENYNLVEEFTEDLLKPIFRHVIKFDKQSSDVDKLLQSEIVKYACKFGIDECEDLAKNSFSNGGIEVCIDKF